MDSNSRITRRSVVKGGVLLGTGLSLAGWEAIAAELTSLPAITKKIPSSGEAIPVIGTGTNAYGVTDPTQLAEIKDVLKNLPLLGGKVVDTARVYGSSEEVIGKLVGELGNREQLFIATKTPIAGAVGDGKAAIEDAFKRLGMTRIDLLQVHNFNGLDTFMPLFDELKQAKRIRYIGCTTSSNNQHEQMLAAMKKHKLDFIQINYSIADRSSAKDILPLAQEKGIAVLNNVPFGGRGGSFLGKVIGKPLPPFAKDFDAETWPQLCLKYNVSHPAITVAIPGTTKIEYLRDNQRAGRGKLPDAALRKRFEEYWDAQGLG